MVGSSGLPSFTHSPAQEQAPTCWSPGCSCQSACGAKHTRELGFTATLAAAMPPRSHAAPHPHRPRTPAHVALCVSAAFGLAGAKALDRAVDIASASLAHSARARVDGLAEGRHVVQRPLFEVAGLLEAEVPAAQHMPSAWRWCATRCAATTELARAAHHTSDGARAWTPPAVRVCACHPIHAQHVALPSAGVPARQARSAQRWEAASGRSACAQPAVAATLGEEQRSGARVPRLLGRGQREKGGGAGGLPRLRAGARRGHIAASKPLRAGRVLAQPPRAWAAPPAPTLLAAARATSASSTSKAGARIARGRRGEGAGGGVLQRLLAHSCPLCCRPSCLGWRGRRYRRWVGAELAHRHRNGSDQNRPGGGLRWQGCGRVAACSPAPPAPTPNPPQSQ